MSIPFNRLTNREILDNFLKQKTGSSSGPCSSKSELDKEGFYYAVVRNIPSQFHTKDLRSFFAEYVENERFDCFHYRHRPEVQFHETDGSGGSKIAESKRCCCIIRFKSEKIRSEFKKDFHMKFWTDSEGNNLSLRCFVFCVKMDCESSTSSNPLDSDTETLMLQDVQTMIEFRPPACMPKGNIGTPSVFFFDQIRQCKLSPAVIKKLGLKVRRCQQKKYGAVPLKYPSGPRASSLPGRLAFSQKVQCDIELGEPRVHPVDIESPEIKPASYELGNNDSGDDSDGECEEWDRYEALYNDVTEQDRTKPKKYEEEMEVTWEKGGPGLVWHTDTAFWNELQEGTDSDWKWADDWDVDYSAYYDRSAGSIDARQAVEIKEDEALRAGKIEPSVFRKKEERGQRKRRYSDSEANGGSFGDFEKHTKGIGSKLLKRFGWKPGSGLGKDESGRVNAVSVEIEDVGGAQPSGQRIGLGYHGERLQRTGFQKPFTHTILTAYDVEKAKAGLLELDDNRDPVLRSGDPTDMKYR